MDGSIVAIVTVVMLTAWHLQTRRNPSWSVSADGRFYIYLGYPMVAIAAYWLTTSPTDTAWEWALGDLWALVAMIFFVYGFNALHRATMHRRAGSRALETIPHGADSPGLREPMRGRKSVD
jgi:uncharacterized membrane protein